jgi:spiro-SPASM protein
MTTQRDIYATPPEADNLSGVNASAILFAGRLSGEAFEKSFDGKNAFTLALKKTAAFPAVVKITVLAPEDFDETVIPGGIERIELVREDSWNVKTFLHALAKAGEGFDLSYFVWADTPFLDLKLARALAARFLHNAAEYAYADGWPDGLAPELLSPGTAGILAKINGDNEAPVERDTIFAVLQKDINAFDIETEIAPEDLRQHRLNLAANSKRNLLLLRRFWDAGLASGESTSQAVSRFVVENPKLLRTLPAFYPVQITSACPQRCSICPYPKFKDFIFFDKTAENAFSYLKLADFMLLLDKIVEFSGDSVIDLSLWGEAAIHPQKIEFVKAVLERPSLSLVIETSGIGWQRSEFELFAAEAAAAAPRKNGMAALSWIVSLDSNDEAEYRKLRGEGFNIAVENARSITALFPKDGYVQAVRRQGNEIDIEKFYRFWKENGANVIIQKYDSFCGALPSLSTADLSPVKRNPCWHIMRDMPILLDGNVPVCRASIDGSYGAVPVPIFLGNALSEDLELIWRRGEALYERHCTGNYDVPCAKCDEYYTFNF